MKLRVWWIANVPGKCHHVPIDSVEEAKKVLTLLTNYDLYLGDLIHSNAGGLEVFNEDDQDWEEWRDEYDYDINDVMLEESYQEEDDA